MNSENERPIVVWFRRDLRIDDHAALWHASRTGAPIIPLFVIDSELITTLPSDGAAFDFQAGALRELEDKLRLLGGKLLLLRGMVVDVHERIIRQFQPSALYFNRDYEPYALRRDERIGSLYRSRGIDVRTFKDSVLLEPDEVLTREGKPYVVFTPYANAWRKLPIPAPFGTPRRIVVPRFASEAIPGARELGKAVRIAEPIFRGGSGEAKKRWKWFLSHGLAGYEQGRDLPSIDGTSRMSGYLRFGTISVRKMWEDLANVRCERGDDGRSVVSGHSTLRIHHSALEKYSSELIWREFYTAVLFHFPRVVESNYRQGFDAMPWRVDRKALDAWKEGRTGFPLVDAGMRQLNGTGWMHNRVRMVVASFLTKDLMHDWRAGARYFEEKLLDIDTAANNGGWQWAASTGVDPKPLRIFNPRLQAERYDPQGEYIRQYIPELRDVPARYIHAPHEMPPLVQEEAGCIIGKHYPAPIVDHRSASAAYKEQFMKLKRGKDSSQSFKESP